MKKRKPKTRHYEGKVVDSSYGHTVIECSRVGSRTPRRYTVLFGPVAADRQHGKLIFTNEGLSSPAEGAEVVVRVRRGRVVCWTVKSHICQLGTNDAPHPYRSKHANSRPAREPVSYGARRGLRSRASSWYNEQPVRHNPAHDW